MYVHVTLGRTLDIEKEFSDYQVVQLLKLLDSVTEDEEEPEITPTFISSFPKIEK